MTNDTTQLPEWMGKIRDECKARSIGLWYHGTIVSLVGYIEQQQQEIEHDRKAVEFLQRIVEDQAATIAKLPMTADGEPITPGMVVYYKQPCLVGEPIGCSTIRRVGAKVLDGPYFITDGSEPIFSTEQAALEHRAEAYKAKADAAALAAAEAAKG